MGGAIRLAPNPPPASGTGGAAPIEALWRRYGDSPADAAANLVEHYLTWDEKLSFIQGLGDAVHTHEYVGTLPAIPRLGIPSTNIQDAGAGFRTTHSSQVGQVA